MKMRNKLLTAVMAVAMVGASAQAATWEFGVNPNETWLGYINIFDQADVYQFGFAEGNLSTASANFAAGPANPLTLGPNTRLYDENILDAGWVDQGTLQANWVSEVNIYQEKIGAVGDTVTFDFETIANTLPAGYEALGFIKVLDGFASWATTQFEVFDLTGVSSGTAHLETTVASPGAGTPFIQAGFLIKGAYVSGGANELGLPADPIASTNLQVVPEPATIGLMGIAGLGMFVARRRLKI